MSLKKMIGGAAFGIMLFFTTYFGILFMLFPFMPLMLFAPSVYRAISSKAIAFWLLNTVGLLEIFYGIKIVITGDCIRSDENSLILMNHRTRLDWMFFWSCIWRQSSLATEKIILKSPLKRIPGPGWAMQCVNYIFINRNWEQDRLVLQQHVDFIKDTKQNNQILLFPEGTDFTAYTKQRSDAFAKKNGLEPYEYVLHPRTTGFVFLAQYMRKEGMLDSVYDVTLGYPKEMPQDEKAILKGEFPNEIHFHVKRHVVQTLPITEDGLLDWCNTRWKEKEAKLKTFYTDTKQFDEPVHYPDNHLMLYITLLYWILFFIFSFILVWCFAVVRWYVIVVSVIYFFMQRVCGGIEFLQMKIHDRFWSQRVKTE